MEKSIEMSFDQLIDAREQIRAGVALLMNDDAGYDARVMCVNDLGASAGRYLSALRSCCEMMFAADNDDTRAALAIKLRAAIDSESIHNDSSFIPDAVTDPESMVRLIEYVTDCPPRCTAAFPILKESLRVWLLPSMSTCQNRKTRSSPCS